jgi:hypothetical protein
LSGFIFKKGSNYLHGRGMGGFTFVKILLLKLYIFISQGFDPNPLKGAITDFT